MTLTYLVFYLGINQLSCYAGGKKIKRKKKKSESRQAQTQEKQPP